MQPSVLVVDDDAVNRRLLIRMLKRLGITSVGEACDGPAALELCAERRYDLIFLDISMPGIDGVETCARIRQGSSGDSSWIVACTAHAARSDLEGFRRQRFDDILTKPFVLAALAAVLAPACQGARGDSAPS